MDDRTKAILGYIAVGIAAALIAGGVTWAIMSTRITDASERAEDAEEQLVELESQVASLAAQVDAMSMVADSSSDDSYAEADESDSSSDDSSEDSDSDEDGRHFCYVEEVTNEGGTTMITVDYADMLTGDEAAAAASAAGEESPPPNDYFISNVNPRLRTFPVESGINVTLTSTADGTNPSGYDVVLGQWQDYFVGMSPGMEVVQHVPYWIEIEDGVVTSIEEQYLP